MSALFSKLVPFRDYLYVAVFVGLIAGGLYVRAKLIDEGEARVNTANAAVSALQVQHNQDVSDIAQALTVQIGDRYVAKINDSPPAGPPIVCLNTVQDGPGPVSVSARDPSLPAGAASQPRSDQYDIGTPLRKVGWDDDALIAALQSEVVTLRDEMAKAYRP